MMFSAIVHDSLQSAVLIFNPDRCDELFCVMERFIATAGAHHFQDLTGIVFSTSMFLAGCL
jgi:hypothetical protein